MNKNLCYKLIDMLSTRSDRRAIWFLITLQNYVFKFYIQNCTDFFKHFLMCEKNR